MKLDHLQLVHAFSGKYNLGSQPSPSLLPGKTAETECL